MTTASALEAASRVLRAKHELMDGNFRYPTVVDCPHDNVTWGRVYSGPDGREANGHCTACGLFITERNGRYFLHDGREIHLEFA